MKQTRRDFIKTNAIAATAAAAGITIPGVQAVAAQDDSGVRWDKAPCRFCGTGCSVLVGTKDERVVATQGDPDAPVNRGLNCIKGYFLSKIMYGQDRLTQPLLRKKNGKYDKEGDFEPVSWDEAFDVMAEKWKAAIRQGMEENKGKPADQITSRVGMFGSRPVDRVRGLCRVEAVQGRLPLEQHRSERASLHGVGGRRIHPCIRFRRTDGLL